MYLLLINLLIAISLLFTLSCGSDEIMLKGAPGISSLETPYADDDLRELPDDWEPTAIVKFSTSGSPIINDTINIKENNVTVATASLTDTNNDEVSLYIGHTYSAEATATCVSNNGTVSQTKEFTVIDGTNEVAFIFTCGEDYVYTDTPKFVSFSSTVSTYQPTISNVSIVYKKAQSKVTVSYSLGSTINDSSVSLYFLGTIRVYPPTSSTSMEYSTSPIGTFSISRSQAGNPADVTVASIAPLLPNKVKVVIDITINPSSATVSDSHITYTKFVTTN